MPNARPVALVTGAGRGIGRAISIELSRAGFDIAGIDWILESADGKDDLISLKPLVESSGAAFLPLQADISDISLHRKLVSEVVGEFGRVDLLVNNAGVAPLERLDILETTPESFDRVLSINLRGGFFLTQVVAREMLSKIGNLDKYQPRIIFITSISAVVSSPNRAEYCISKAGLSMAATVFADRLAESGIRVYEIQPGIIDTDMTAPARDKYDKLIKEGLIPLGRWGSPEDVAKAVVAIAKGSFDYATGIKIDLSGGMNIRHL